MLKKFKQIKYKLIKYKKIKIKMKIKIMKTLIKNKQNTNNPEDQTHNILNLKINKIQKFNKVNF